MDRLREILTWGNFKNIYLFLFIITIVILLVFLYTVTRDKKREDAVFARTYRSDIKKNYLSDVILKELKNNIDDLMIEKGKPKEKGQQIFNILLGIVIALSIFMLAVRQPVFAVVLPIVLLIVMTKVTGIVKKTFNDYVLQQLPAAIEAVIRVFSGYSDLKTILYEASKTLENPMRTIFEDMSRKMTNDSPENVLQEFMDSSKNIWIYSMTFSLLSYVEDAEKKDVIKNLRTLKENVDRNNTEKAKQKLERKMTTTVNYVLCVIAFVFFFANLIFNKDSSVHFFFGTVPGILCFLIGMTLLVVSIFSNLLIGSGKDE